MDIGNLYEILGVARNADSNEIRKAFLKLSRIHHPDKGGNPEEFKKISLAHEVLTDNQKRAIYDQTGSIDGDTMSHMGGMNGFPFDIGSIFGGMGMGGMFGMGGMPRGGRMRRPKAPPKVQEIPLRLSDYYHGRIFQVKFERHKFCETCKGEGATSFQSCNSCKGMGVVRQIMQMGPIQMVNEGPCHDCMGEGKKASGACYVCSGKKTKPQEKELEVKIEPGMKPGEILIFANECSDDPNFEEPGDVHFLLQEADGDEGWTRKGDDLETDVHITLRDSLLGCSKMLQGHPGFPEGLSILVPCGVQNGEVIKIADRGMTKKEGGYGTLHVKINLTITEKEKEALVNNQPILSAMFNTIPT